MYDASLYALSRAHSASRVFDRLGLIPGSYAVATLHRAENTDHHERLKSIFYAFEQISQNGLPVIIPLHPRTRQSLKNSKFKIENPPYLRRIQNSKLTFIDPVSYLDMLLLEKNAHVILTDSGGVQKEACWFKVPCVTLRDETEWIETLNCNWNFIVGTDKDLIIEKVSVNSFDEQGEYYGDGKAGEKIVKALLNY